MAKKRLSLLVIVLSSCLVASAQTFPNDGDIRTITQTGSLSSIETSCDPYGYYVFYENSPVYFLVFSEQLKVDNYGVLKESYAWKYGDIFEDTLKIPFTSSIQPKAGTANTPGTKVIVAQATGSKFVIKPGYNIPRNQIAGQLVTITDYRLLYSINPMRNYYYTNSLNAKYTMQASEKFSVNANIKKACVSYYMGRCGDGVIDKASGDGSTDGLGGGIVTPDGFKSWHAASIKPNEMCDDGADNGKAGKCKVDCSGIGGGEDPTGALTVNKTIVGGSTNFAVGNNIQFRIDFNNQSNQTINNVKIEDLLPAGLSYISSEIHGATNYIFSTGMESGIFKVNYTGFSLASGQNGYILINTEMLACNSIINSAFWAGGAFSGLATAQANCQSTAELAFSKKIDKSNLILGETVGFRIEVTNNILKPMSNVVIKDIWPSNCISIVGTPTDSTWTFSNINIGEAKLITFNGQVSNSPSCAGTHINTAKIDYTTDGTAKTTTTTVSFIVSAITQNMSITKTRIGTQEVGPGSDVIFEIEYRNNGVNNINGFRVIDTLSNAFEYVSSEIIEGIQPVSFPILNQRQLIWNFFGKTVAPGEGGKIEVKLRIK